MTNPTKIQIDCSTGIETVIELTDEEVAELETQALKADEDRAEREAEAAAKLEAKQAVLAKLGLTAEEAAALLA
tara:strand:+ start:2387 stop:2608 length:222 start_codon:yes stop_codon:yes gene_type:complete